MTNERIFKDVSTMVFRAIEITVHSLNEDVTIEDDSVDVKELRFNVYKSIVEDICKSTRYVIYDDEHKPSIMEIIDLRDETRCGALSNDDDILHILRNMPESSIRVRNIDGTLFACDYTIGLGYANNDDDTKRFITNFKHNIENNCKIIDEIRTKLNYNIDSNMVGVYITICELLAITIANGCMGFRYTLLSDDHINVDPVLSVMHTVMFNTLISQLSKDIIVPGHYITAHTCISNNGETVRADTKSFALREYW